MGLPPCGDTADEPCAVDTVTPDTVTTDDELDEAVVVIVDEVAGPVVGGGAKPRPRPDSAGGMLGRDGLGGRGTGVGAIVVVAIVAPIGVTMAVGVMMTGAA